MENPDRAAILITGAAKRLGLSIAHHAAAQGLDIALHCHHSLTEANNAASELQQGCGVFQADLSDIECLDALVSNVTTQFPRLRALVNCASVFAPSKMSEETDEFVMNTLQTNLLAPWKLARLCSSHWQERSDGLIVNFTDQRLTRAAQGHFAYNISKHGLKAFTEIAALELAPHTRVNAIAPGVILAPPEIDEPNAVAEFLQRKGNEVPLQRSGTEAEIGNAFDYLLNNEFVTGQTLFVDGGEHLS